MLRMSGSRSTLYFSMPVLALKEINITLKRELRFGMHIAQITKGRRRNLSSPRSSHDEVFVTALCWPQGKGKLFFL